VQLISYLTFNGQCEAAFKFYEQCLGGKIVSMFTYAGSPMEDQAPPEWRDKVMHARLAVGDQLLMGSDATPERYEPPRGITVSLSIADPQEAERIFNALEKNANVTMPMQKTFWSAGFGMLTDQFGIPCMVNCEQPA
jgi:PhnB protein